MKRTQWALLTLAALCIGRLWLMPLASSFWIDEMGTVFVVRMGAGHPSLAVAPQVPASAYFWLPRAVQWMLELAPPWASGTGFLETFYRLPSAICMLLALAVIARVAARIISPWSAWFAVFACLALRGFDYEAADARPYALGSLVAATAVYFLIRWMDAARWADAVIFVAAAALLWRVHLIYWPFYAVFVLYAAVRVGRKETEVTWARAGAVFAVLGILLLPVIAAALAIFQQASAHVIVAVPGKSELWRSLKFGLIALCGSGAWALRKFRGGAGTSAASSSWVLILSWWLMQPLGLFAFSWITGSSVFVDRYLSLALPGAALVATAMAARFLDARQGSIASLLLGAGVLVLLGQWDKVWPPHHNSDWRGAVQAINALPFGPDLPVVMPSPFIEAKAPAWSPTYALPGFLYAHLAVYRVVGMPVLLPYAGGPYDRGLTSGKHFVLYGAAPSIRDARAWFVTQPRFRGWRNGPLGDFGDVEAVLFDAP